MSKSKAVAIRPQGGKAGQDEGGSENRSSAANRSSISAVPKGSSLVRRGQPATMSDAYRQLLFGLAFAVALIYLLVVVNFQRWFDPFVIVSSLPTALAGIVWTLFVTRTTVSVPALTGAIMCMGVATAKSVLVIFFARERMAEGVDA